MKISKTKLHQIIKEELQNVLSEVEDDDGQATTIYGPRAGKKLAGKPALRYDTAQPRQQKDSSAGDQDKTMPSAVASAIKRDQELPHAPTYRERATKVYEEYFGTYGPDALEIMTHTDPELYEILSKLAGWDTEERTLPSGSKWRIHDLFPYDTQPSPTFVEVGLEFLKAGKDILDNEAEFLSSVEKKLYAVGLRDFATTGAGTEKDLTSLAALDRSELRSAADREAVAATLEKLKEEDPEKYGRMKSLDAHSSSEYEALAAAVRELKPELYKSVYDEYLSGETEWLKNFRSPR